MTIEKTFLSAAVLAAAAAFVAATASAADMKIGFVTINDSQHRVAEYLTAELPKRTGGAIKPRVYPSGQLGTIPRQIEALQLGAQEAFISPPGFFIGINRAFQAADAPALFADMDHMYRALNEPSVRDRFLDLAVNKGVKGLAIWGAGDTWIASRNPLKTLDDLKGRKIRVLATPIERAMMKSLGATGVPMDYTEIIPALQQGTVDGARSAIVVMGPSKFHTAAKHILREDGSFIPSVFWVSTAWWKKLSAEHQKIVTEVAREASPIGQKVSVDLKKVWATKWASEGGVVHELSAADREKLMATYRPLGDAILGTMPEVAPMYELVKKAAAATQRPE